MPSSSHLWGQIFISSSEGLRIKSTKALLYVGVGKGGGSVSTAQNLFLANPCCSRGPRLPNCTHTKNIPFNDEHEQRKQERWKGIKSRTYLRKTYWNATTNCFRRLINSLHKEYKNFSICFWLDHITRNKLEQIKTKQISKAEGKEAGRQNNNSNYFGGQTLPSLKAKI